MAIRTGTFPEAWSAPIKPIVESFMNGRIQIIDLSGTDTVPYDPITNTGGTPQPKVVYDGKARIQHIYTARGSNIEGEWTRNPGGSRTINFQIPLESLIDGVAMGRIERGWQIRITDPGNDAVLDQYLYYINSAVNSSWAIVRTITASMDVEAEPGWQ